MNDSRYFKLVQRKSIDFPVKFYHIDKTHHRYVMNSHCHNEFELLRVIAGELYLYVDKEEFHLISGDSMLIPSGVFHQTKPNNCIYEVIDFSPTLIYVNDNCKRLIKSNIKGIFQYRNSEIVEEIFSSLINSYVGYEFQFLCGLYRLIYDITFEPVTSDVTPMKASKYDKIKPAITLIEENYNMNFTLSQLARSCNMSPNYFCRLFKELTGKTPFDYINIYRIDVASQMLSLGVANVTEIAYNCGFNDLSYFIRTFRKYKGMSPKAYSRTIQKD